MYRMHSLSNAIVFLVALHAMSSALFADEPSHKWAILIGVDDYINAEDLRYCSADQQALKESLATSGFESERIFLLADNATDNQYRPFKSNIEKQIELVAGLAEPGDMLLFAFSGHGVTLDGKSYLCPTDANLDDASTLISVDDIKSQLLRCRASLRLVVIDACRNDPRFAGRRSASSPHGTRQFAESLQQDVPHGVVILNSCAPGEVSWEDEKFGHGVFMHYMLEGLRGAADADHNGTLTLGEISKFAADSTKLFVARQRNDSQRPFMSGEWDIDALSFELGRAGLASKFTSPTTGMELVLISAGEFMMGSPDDEEQRFDVEKQHRVRIARPFYLGKYEVTQREYEQVMGYNPSRFSPRWVGSEHLSVLETDRFPVEEATWYDAAEFCNRLSQRDGLTPRYLLTSIGKGDEGQITSAEVEILVGSGYQLPTEAQWEYACRAGTTTPFHFGLVSNGRQANVLNDLFSSGLKRATVVGDYDANSWGLYDMHGNVFEWCQDWYGSEYYSTSPVVDPVGPTGGEYRVLRGGSWSNFSRGTRSAYRSWLTPGDRNTDIGFRVARTP